MPAWLPLESNPDLLNGFLERMGVKQPLKFHDVLGLDEELLCMVPPGCEALCLLFPYKRIHDMRSQRQDAMVDPQNQGIVYMKQLDQFGNACGTFACLHAIANSSTVQFTDDSLLSLFLDKIKGLDAEASGLALAEEKSIHEASEESASHGQTATPTHEDIVEGHFITFVLKNGRILELDGRMPGVIDHGKTDSFLYDTSRVIRDEFMAVEPESLMFNVVALCPDF